MRKRMANTQLGSSTEIMKVTKVIRITGSELIEVATTSKVFDVKHEINARTGQPSKLVSRELVHEEMKRIILRLREVNDEEIEKYRNDGTPSFVLKIGDCLYHTEIPKDVSMVGSSVIGTHKCAAVGKECNRLSGESDEEGGCAKVRAFSRGIQNFPWIRRGVETFNTSHDAFLVGECDHYEKIPPKSRGKESK